MTWHRSHTIPVHIIGYGNGTLNALMILQETKQCTHQWSDRNRNRVHTSGAAETETVYTLVGLQKQKQCTH